MEMQHPRSEFRRLAATRLELEGLSWLDLQAQASQIILFGSYALSLETEASDLDLLCVGRGKRFKSATLHVIWVSEERTTSDDWLGSELATHICAYGKWLKGENTWPCRYAPSDD